MKKLKGRLEKFRIAFTLFLLLVLCGNVKAQQFNLFRYADFNGDALPDWAYWTSNAYIGILHGIPGGAWPVGSQVRWTWYYYGNGGAGTYIVNGGTDLDGYSGLEVTMWLAVQQTMYVITDRTMLTKGYYVGFTGINQWVQCNNSFTNLDGLPGAEIMLNYYARSNSSKKGYMIRHRSQTTKSTWSCFNLTSAVENSGGINSAHESDDSENLMDNSFDNSEFFKKGRLMEGRLEKLVVPPYAKEFKLEELLSIGEEIRVSPNPAQNTINIALTGGEFIQKIIITNASGSIVLSSNSNSNSVDISKFSKGIYFVRIRTSKKTFTKKILKE